MHRYCQASRVRIVAEKKYYKNLYEKISDRYLVVKNSTNIHQNLLPCLLAFLAVLVRFQRFLRPLVDNNGTVFFDLFY